MSKNSAQRHQILVEWNHTVAPSLPATTVKDLVERRVELSPDAVAVVFEGRELTYRELDRRANGLAAALVADGIGPDDVVALHLERGFDMVVAILAVHKAGGAYLPLDPAFPAGRLEYMLRNAEVKVALAHSSAALTPPPGTRVLFLDNVGEEAEGPKVRVDPANLAYVIYTSGSTGRPKGVQLTQGGLLNLVFFLLESPGASPEDVQLAVVTLSFDMAVPEVFLPLVTGGRVVVAPQKALVDGAHLAELLATSGATTLQATPVTWKLLLQAGWKGDGRLRMCAGGEALTRRLADELLARGGALWNLYGPTETTVYAAHARIRSGPGPVPIGRPVTRSQLHVLDDALGSVPVGSTGSLYIGGACLARGYLDLPAMTAERFIPDPFNEEPGSRLYVSGDLVRLAGDGQVEYLGRADDQVKIRGFRIELKEIEVVLLEHPGLRDAVVVAASTATGEKYLVAYLVASDAAPSEAELREFQAEQLPDYMRPARLHFLEKLPLTPNKKVDRRALAALTAEEAATPSGARTATEELVLDTWAGLLGHGSLKVDDDFFAVGGHSLLVGQVAARLRRALDFEVPANLLYEYSTGARFARAIDAWQRAGDAGLPAFEAVSRSGPLPLSFAQERLWLYDQLESGSSAFNMAYAIRLRGELSIPGLDVGLTSMIDRHEVLRTRIGAGPHPAQVILPPPARALSLVDLSRLGDDRVRDQEARRLAAELESFSFDLSRGPLVSAVLLVLAGDDHVFCLTMHHIIADGWSLGVFVRELMDFYGALRGSSPVPPHAGTLQYADFAVWQRRWLDDDLLATQLEHWSRQFEGHDVLALVPTDRPSRRAGGKVGVLERSFPPELCRSLRRVGEESGATLFMIFLAAVQLLLHRYTGSREVAVGTMHANRMHSAVENMLGLFVNLLPLPTTVDPDQSFRDLLKRVRHTALAAFAHQDVPFEEIVRRVRPNELSSRNALFQVMVLYQNMTVPPLRLPGLDVARFYPGHVKRRAAFDLTWIFVPGEEGVDVTLEFDTGLFERATAERLWSHLEAVLRDVALALSGDPDPSVMSLPRGVEVTGSKLAGRLWLTDPAREPRGPDVPAEETAHAAEKAKAIQSRVADRRSKLSSKQLALLKQRLKK